MSISDIVLIVYKQLLGYREREARKFFSEEASDYSNYDRSAIYKNRVRIADIFLPAAVAYLKHEKKLKFDPEITEIP